MSHPKLSSEGPSHCVIVRSRVCVLSVTASFTAMDEPGADNRGTGQAGQHPFPGLPPNATQSSASSTLHSTEGILHEEDGRLDANLVGASHDLGDSFNSDVDENEPLLRQHEEPRANDLGLAASLKGTSGPRLQLGTQAKFSCDRSLMLRLFFLFLASAMCFGQQVAYDSIGAAAPMIRKTLHVESSAIGDLYSAYHLPNTIMVILGGIFADRIGTIPAAFIFSGFVCVGTVIVAFAAPYSFPGMLFGRAVFGLGAESLTIVQISMLTQWFATSNSFPNLALSMAVASSVSAFGTVLAYDAVPFVGQVGGLGEAMWGLGAFPCFLSLVAIFILSIAQRFTKLEDINETSSAKDASSDNENAGPALGEEIDLSTEGNIQQESALSPAEEGLSGKQIKMEKGDIVDGSGALSISHIIIGIYHFSGFFWTMLLFLVSFVASSGAWNNFAVDIYVQHFDLTQITAGKLNSVATGLLVFLGPLFGYYMDRHGGSRWICLTGSVLMTIPHLVLCFFAKSYHSETLFLACELFLGLGQAMIQTAVFPLLATAVPPRFVSSALGVAAAFMNLAMVLFPFLAGLIHDQTGSYLDSMMMFVLQDVFCVVVISIVLSQGAQNKMIRG